MSEDPPIDETDMDGYRTEVTNESNDERLSTDEDPIATRTRVPPMSRENNRTGTESTATDRDGSDEYEPVYPYTRTP